MADPKGDEEFKLFSHFLWNSSLLMAEFIEAGTLLSRKDKPVPPQTTPSLESPLGPPLQGFDITGLSTLELGAGSGLPSMMSALHGARRVVITDYPAPAVIANLRANVERNLSRENRPAGVEVEVLGHAWGDIAAEQADGEAARLRGAFDRVLVCDCLWMPWQHDKLLRSIGWFLAPGPAARCWVVAGFHTGRASMREFFLAEGLAREGLEVEKIWERDCDGAEREWCWDRGVEDVGERKRWLVFAVLKRTEVADEIRRS